jgi:hypothetical protein
MGFATASVRTACIGDENAASYREINAARGVLERRAGLGQAVAGVASSSASS